MALTQPILNSIAAFDATQEHIFSFISIGGDQVIGSQLTIYDNETGSQVYQGNYTSFKFEYPLPAGTLTNGKYYNATISTINNSSEFSEPSNPVAFYCYTTPVLTIINIPASGTIEQSNYTFQGNYVQAEGELLNGYQYTLYNSNREQISQSAILYDGLYQYTFSGMANDTSYYVELSGSTVNNTPVSSGLLLFTIRYIQPASFAICDLANNCENGFIQISSNIVSIDGKSEPDPPKYIDNKEVDLTDDGSWVQWDEGFNIQNDFTMRIWGRSFGDNEPIVTMKNELDTDKVPNRIEMKFMATNIIDTLPNYIFAEGDIITAENAVNEPITDLNIGGNRYQETTQGKNLFNNTLKGYAYYGNPAKTISTGVRLSALSPITTSDAIFTVYSIMDLSNFVGKTVRMKTTYKSNSALIGGYKIGLCNDKAGNRKSKASSSFAGQEISFVVPELIGEQKYLAIWFYTNAGGTGAVGDYVDYTNVIVTIDNEDITYEPYTGGAPSPNPDYPSEVHFTGDIGNQIDFPDTSVSYTDGSHVAAKPNNNYILLPNRIYTLNFDYVVTNSTTDIYYGIGYGTKDNYVGAISINGDENIQYTTQNTGNNSITFQTPSTFEGADTPYLWIDFAKTIITATVAVDISNVSLYFGKYTEYQTYGRYNVPFKILGQNLFNYQKLLYFIDNNTTHEIISNGYSINPTVQNSDCYVSIGYTNNFVAGEKYTLSYQTLGTITSFNLYAVEKGTSEIANEITLTNGIFVAPDNNYDLMLKFTLDSSDLTNNVNIWNIQIAKGEELLDYVAYTENGLNMNFEQPLGGIGNVRDYILLDNVNLINPTTLRANVKENTTYYFSNNTTNSYLLEFYNAEDNLIDSEDITKGAFTTPANCTYITSENFTTANVISERLQIEEGDTFSQYFPYITQPSVIRNIGKINLKDVSSWFQDKELSNSNRFYTNEIIYANGYLALSDYFKSSTIQDINTVDEQGLCVANNRQIALRINKTLVTNVNELKQWLLEHNVEVYYRLSTPQVYNLSGDYATALRNFTTQVGTNNILVDSQYPGYLALKYANSYTDQETKANYVLLKCWNENTIPYVIHSNYITVKSPTEKIFIWTRRKNNIFDLRIENLGEE